MVYELVAHVEKAPDLHTAVLHCLPSSASSLVLQVNLAEAQNMVSQPYDLAETPPFNANISSLFRVAPPDSSLNVFFIWVKFKLLFE